MSDNSASAFKASSDFGTGLTNSTDVGRYIAQRGATFFQAVMNGITGSLNRDVFIECENKRVKCNTPDNPVSCDTPACELSSLN